MQVIIPTTRYLSTLIIRIQPPGSLQLTTLVMFAVCTGIEPAIFAVTVRRVTNNTSRPKCSSVPSCQPPAVSSWIVETMGIEPITETLQVFFAKPWYMCPQFTYSSGLLLTSTFHLPYYRILHYRGESNSHFNSESVVSWPLDDGSKLWVYVHHIFTGSHTPLSEWG